MYIWGKQKSATVPTTSLGKPEQSQHDPEKHTNVLGNPTLLKQQSPPSHEYYTHPNKHR